MTNPFKVGDFVRIDPNRGDVNEILSHHGKEYNLHTIYTVKKVNSRTLSLYNNVYWNWERFTKVSESLSKLTSDDRQKAFNLLDI